MSACQNASPWTQEREFLMRRKRFQKGSVRPRKHGRQKVWVAQWWEQGKKKSKVLGRCASMPKSEAEARLAVILKPFNEGAGQSQTPVYTFGVYLEEVFLPVVRRKWKESTRVTTEPRMTYHLLPALGDRLLQQITREQMQAFLDQKALKASRSTVDHLRWDLNSVFKMAVSDGIVPFNPATALFTPPCKPEGEKRVLTPVQVRQVLTVFETRERLIFRLAVFEGLRPGEILALRLCNVFDDHLAIEQRVYKGKLDTPKGRKGKRTARKVALSTGTSMEIAIWRTMLLKQRRMGICFRRSEILHSAEIISGVGKCGRSWRPSDSSGLHSRFFAEQTRVCLGKPRSTTRSPLISGATDWESAWRCTPTAILSKKVKQ